MGIENQTLVHFRHFRHFSSLLTIFPSTLVERTLQIAPFMQNKANFQKSQMNVSDLLIREYGKMDTWSSGKNKAKTKPIQTQFKPNTNPIQTQFKPNTNPNKPNFKGKKCFSAIDGKWNFGYCTGAILGFAYRMLYIEAEK